MVMRLVIVAILVMAGQSAVAWDSNQHMKMGGVKLAENLLIYSKDQSPQTFLVEFQDQLPQEPKYSGISLGGFYLLPNTYFSFNLSLVQVLSFQLLIESKIEQTSIFIVFNAYYIVVDANQVYGKVQVYTQFYYTYEIQNFTRVDSNTQVLQGQNNLILPVKYNIASALAGFNLAKESKQPDVLSVKSWINGTVLMHEVTTSCNNTIQYVVINTVLSEIDQNYKCISQFVDQTISEDDNFNLSRFNGDAFSHANRIYLGIYSLFMNGNQRVFNYSLVDNLTQMQNTLSIMSTDVIKVSGFLYAIQSCDQPNQIYGVAEMICYPSGSSTPDGSVKISNVFVPCAPQCKRCPQTNLSQCQSCFIHQSREDSTPDCKCKTGYVQVGKLICPDCSQYIPGCKQCISTTNCTTCNDQLQVNPDDAKCICKQNKNLVGQYCLDYKGCVRAIQNSGTNISCLECDLSLNFVDVNLKCQCKSGYELTGESCTSICGDGKSIDEKCDDGNNENGDGCSSICTQQIGYICSSYAEQKTICLPLQPITLTYKYAQNPLYTNNVTIYFDVQPTNLNISSNFFEKMVIISFSDSYSVTYDNQASKLTIKAEYSSTIQDTTQQISIQYELKSLIEKGFFSRNTTNSVYLQGINTELIYKSNTILYYILQYYMYALTITIFLIAFLVSMANNKLIGLELIMPIQAIFYTMLCLQQYRIQFSPLRQLKYLGGYNFFTSSAITQIPKLSKLGLEQQFIFNHNIFFFVLGLMLFMLIIHFIIRYKCWKLEKMQQIITTFQLNHPILDTDSINGDETNTLNNKDKQLDNAAKEKEAISAQLQSLEHFEWLFYDRIFVFFLIVTIQPALVFFIINLSVPPQFVYLPGISCIYCFTCLITVTGFISFFMIQSKQENQRTIELTSQSRNYSHITILYWPIVSVLIGLSFSFSTYSFYYLIPLPLILIGLQIKLRPYQIQIQVFPDDANAYLTMTIINYNTFASIYNILLYSVSLTIFIILSFIKTQDQTGIIIIMVLVALITLSVIFSIIRFIKAFELIDCQLFGDDGHNGKGMRKVIRKQFKNNRKIDTILQQEMEQQAQFMRQELKERLNLVEHKGDPTNEDGSQEEEEQDNQLNKIKKRLRRNFRNKAKKHLTIS